MHTCTEKKWLCHNNNNTENQEGCLPYCLNKDCCFYFCIVSVFLFFPLACCSVFFFPSSCCCYAWLPLPVYLWLRSAEKNKQKKILSLCSAHTHSWVSRRHIGVYPGMSRADAGLLHNSGEVVGGARRRSENNCISGWKMAVTQGWSWDVERNKEDVWGSIYSL